VEGEWLNEELDAFSDDEMQEGLRPDGYEDDGFLSEDTKIYFKKNRRKEERYPLQASRGRGSDDLKPIVFRLPPCEPHPEQIKPEEVEFHKFSKSCAGLQSLSNSLILSESPRRVPPQSVKNWLRKILSKKRKRSGDDNNMLKVQKLAFENKKAKKNGKVKKRTEKRKRIDDKQSSSSKRKKQ